MPTANAAFQQNAAFNVAGPTSVTVTPSGQEFFIGDNPPAMNWGIQFNANATPPSGYTGTLTWIQLVQSFQYTWIYSDGDQPTTCTYTPGFDAGSPPSYPYATGAYAEDGPLIGLESPPNNDEIEQTASGQYQMYLMWNPSIGSGTSVSIPVPLGSLTWNIAGDVVWSAGTGAWVEVTADSNATTKREFHNIFGLSNLAVASYAMPIAGGPHEQESYFRFVLNVQLLRRSGSIGTAALTSATFDHCWVGTSAKRFTN